MKQKFDIGDSVWVHDDEGLDLPTEAQGKFGVVSGYLYHEGEVAGYEVNSPTTEFQNFVAASYHILKLPKLRMYDSAKNIMGILHANDPDLHERVHEISTSHHRLRNFTDATACFVLMWLGVHAITDDPQCLKGSGVHEIVK